MTRGQIKGSIRENLADSGIVRVDESNLNESFQDAYDDIACLTQCIIKNVTLNWVSDLSYYDFRSLGVSDYLRPLGIFNNVTNLWLADNLTVKDFDRIRIDWEKWNGTPQFWAPVSPKYIAIAAKYLSSGVAGAFNSSAFYNAYYIGTISDLGTFNLHYSAIAPTIANDSESLLVASDMDVLFETYCTADLLEAEGEFMKASDYWERYYTDIDKYANRVKNLSKSDLLLRL